jgi:NADH dehydrogenase FAD-containing subunit
VCILGGGFGGLYTALRLENLLWPQGTKPQVTLIDQSDRFVFKPLLYELLNGAASADEVAPTFSQLLAPYSVNFVQVRSGLPGVIHVRLSALFSAAACQFVSSLLPL